MEENLVVIRFDSKKGNCGEFNSQELGLIDYMYSKKKIGGKKFP